MTPSALSEQACMAQAPRSPIVATGPTQAPTQRLSPAPLVHVGFMKAGSSFLQRHVLTRDYRLDNAFATRPGHAEAIDRLLCVNPFDFDAASVRGYFVERWQQTLEEHLVPVLSIEELSGYPFIHRNDERDVSFRLRQVLPEAKILIIVREQRAMIRSCWCHYLGICGDQPISRFVGKPDVKPGYEPICRIRRFRFDSFVSHYQELFGKDRVCVLPLELLGADQHEFVRRIFAFSECGYDGSYETAPPEFQSNAPANLMVRHLAGRFIRRDTLGESSPWTQRLTWRLGGLVSRLTPARLQDRIGNRWKRYIDEYTDGYFAESNARLGALTGLDLARFGYQCES